MKSLFAESIRLQLEENGGKISKKYIDELAEGADKVFLHPTPRTRICVLILDSGHEVVGVARVLDPENDNEEIGNKVALANCVDQLWGICGNIALAL